MCHILRDVRTELIQFIQHCLQCSVIKVAKTKYIMLFLHNDPLVFGGKNVNFTKKRGKLCFIFKIK